jgi:hypothetical protein
MYSKSLYNMFFYEFLLNISNVRIFVMKIKAHGDKVFKDLDSYFGER